jgi:ribosomal-protein-alanine N-acetyltransferase
MPATTSLRPYIEQDREPLRKLFANPEVMRFVGNGRPIVEKPDMIDRIFAKYQADRSFFVWAIEENGEYAGHADLKRRAGRPEYELIYILETRRWGRGLGGAVADLIVAEAMAREMPFIIATVHADNEPSLSILKKRGFAYDARLSAELDTVALKLELTGPQAG